MSNPNTEMYGPPTRSSCDWYFTPRPGRHLDAANVRLAPSDEEIEARQRLRDERYSGFRGHLRHLLRKIVELDMPRHLHFPTEPQIREEVENHAQTLHVQSSLE
jgi:hypothetical protein